MAGEYLYARIAVVFVGTAASSSVLQGFPTIEPMLLDRRPGFGGALFASLCTNSSVSGGAVQNGTSFLDACPEQLAAAASLYSMSMGLSTVSTLAQGCLFDHFGPRLSGVGGALTNAAALAAFALALSSPSLNWLMWIATPLADCSGALASMALYGFAWHLPAHQGLLAALFASSIGLSTYAAAAAEWLVRGPLQLSPAAAWLVFATAAVASAFAATFAPSADEYHRVASRAMGMPSHPRQSSSLLQMCRETLSHFGRNRALSVLFLGWTCLGNAAMVVWAASLVQLLESLLPPAPAQTLIGLFAPISGLGASIVQPALGRLLDVIGLRLYLPFVNVGLGTWFVLLGAQSYGAQLLSLVIGTLAMSGFSMVIMRWAAVTVPPSLIGTAFGLSFGAAGVWGMVAQALGPYLGAALYGKAASESARALLLPIRLCGACTLAFGLGLTLAFLRGTRPEAPEDTLAEAPIDAPAEGFVYESSGSALGGGGGGAAVEGECTEAATGAAWGCAAAPMSSCTSARLVEPLLDSDAKRSDA